MAAKMPPKYKRSHIMPVEQLGKWFWCLRECFQVPRNSIMWVMNWFEGWRFRNIHLNNSQLCVSYSTLTFSTNIGKIKKKCQWQGLKFNINYDHNMHEYINDFLKWKCRNNSQLYVSFSGFWHFVHHLKNVKYIFSIARTNILN